MCHGQIIGSALVRAHRNFRCASCEKVMVAGDAHVRHQVEPYEGGERKNGDPRVENWRLCRRCAIEWAAVQDLAAGGCPWGPREYLRGKLDDDRSDAIKALRSARRWFRKAFRLEDGDE